MAQAHFEPTWAFIKRPGGYPTGPRVGKEALIINTNSSALYHRFSPYSNYSQNGGLLNWGEQPFYYVYIDQAKNFPNARAMQTQVLPVQDSIIDTQRVTKFLVSGAGVTFLATQFLLQTGNAFNETRIYNPTSPIVAAAMGLTLGAVRPQRFIDTSGGIGGIAQSLLGGAGALLAGGSSIQPPSGTTGVGALPTANAQTDGKGLLRAGDANKGLANFKAKWTPSKGGTNSFLSVVSNLVGGLFANFIPAKQKDIVYKSDEGSYGIMVSAASPRFDYVGASGTTYPFGQMFIAGAPGKANIRKESQYTTKPTRIFVTVENGVTKQTAVPVNGTLYGYVGTVGAVGYTVSVSGIANKPGYRYGDSIDITKNADNKQFQGSDVMYQYYYYYDDGQKFPTKDPEASKIDEVKLKNSLDKIVKDIQKSGYYTVTPDGTIMRDSSTDYNYDRVSHTKNKNQSPNNYQFGFLKAYRDTGVRMVSDDIATSHKNSLKLPTAGYADTLNTLGVLKSSDRDTDTWRPYDDDQIALYFYDVVNDKYIPFRAAVKGIAESGNASWEEMPFIGRADKVYFYGGFNRNLSFNLKIVIGSIAELAPTWQRINYMMTSYKPSNYTKKTAVSSGNSRYDRFMVPPMFMLTIGDLYKDQPVLIQSMTLTVPDDAIWETQNEDNTKGDWNYMANLIKAPGSLFGQVPRDVEIGVTAILLEKERAVVGGANFGHAPRTEDFVEWNDDTVPIGKDPNDWNSNYVVEVPGLA